MCFLIHDTFLHIDKCLREALPFHKNIPSSGFPIILIRDLTQMLEVKEIPLYSISLHGTSLWNKFNIVVTLEIIFDNKEATLHRSPLVKSFTTLGMENLLLSIGKFSCQGQTPSFLNMDCLLSII